MVKETIRTSPLRRSAAAVLGGQLLYIVVTQFHAGGDANDHHAIFAEYAASGLWNAVHLLQFASMTIMLGGLLGVAHAVATQSEAPRWMTRLATAATAAALALYGALQAVDGVALKRAVTAWTSAPDLEKPVRFATAEAVRWLEWGMRSYHDVALGVAVLLLAAVSVRTRAVPRSIASVIALSGLAYLLQAWLLASGGFSPAHSVAIIAGWVFSLVWMAWLTVAPQPASVSSSPVEDGRPKPTTKRASYAS